MYRAEIILRVKRVLQRHVIAIFNHFEITGYLCNLIGSQGCDSFTNRTIFVLNRIFFSANEYVTVKQNNQSDFKVSLT